MGSRWSAAPTRRAARSGERGRESRCSIPTTGRPCPPARFDENGRLSNPDEAIGELVGTSGRGAFEGYWRNDEAEAERIRDGRFHTGDLAYRDADGWLYFAGRSDGWVRVDGENLAIAPIRTAIADHPDVLDAVVLAVPDPDVGDQLLAVVVPRPDAESGDRVAASLLTHLRARDDLGAKAIPRFLRIVDELPRTATHKVRTADLQASGWWATDDVRWLPPRPEGGYVRLHDGERDELAARVHASGRGDAVRLTS